MTTETMVERVARAMEPSAFRQFESLRDYCLRSGDDQAMALSTANWAHGADVRRAMEAARAAIEAMREPTWPMQIAGRDIILAEDDELDLSTDDARAAWRAMISAALKEGSE